MGKQHYKPPAATGNSPQGGAAGCADSMQITEGNTISVTGNDGERAMARCSASVGDDGSFSFSVVLLCPTIPDSCRAELSRRIMAALARGIARAQASGLPMGDPKGGVGGDR